MQKGYILMSRHSNTKNPLWLPLPPEQSPSYFRDFCGLLPISDFHSSNFRHPTLPPQEGAVTCFFYSVIPSTWNVFHPSPHPMSSQPSSLLSSKLGLNDFLKFFLKYFLLPLDPTSFCLIFISSVLV